MTKFGFGSMIILISLLTGCSDQNSTKSTVEPISQSAAPIQKSVVTKELPTEIKGFAFELGGKCAIDLINKDQGGEVVAIKHVDGLTVEGWAFDDLSGTVPPNVVLQLAKGGDFYYSNLTRREGREDLVKAFGKPVFSSAGYVASLDISGLPNGEYEILIVQKGESDNKVCSTYRKLVLRD